METVRSADHLPRLSITFPVKVIVPEVVRKPVVKELDVEEYPPPVML